MSTLPTRPDDEEDMAEEIDRILAERDATFEKDRETAEPWSKVKAEVITQLKNPATPLKLSLTKWAKADIIRAGGWYEQKRDGLGGEFVYQVDAGGQ